MVEQPQLQVQIMVRVEVEGLEQLVEMVHPPQEERVETVYHLISVDMMCIMVVVEVEAHIALELLELEAWVVEELVLQETPQMQPKIRVVVEVGPSGLEQQEELADQALL